MSRSVFVFEVMCLMSLMIFSGLYQLVSASSFARFGSRASSDRLMRVNPAFDSLVMSFVVSVDACVCIETVVTPLTWRSWATSSAIFG